METIKCIFEFIMSVQTWLTQSGLIPISAIVAIALFTTREYLEYRRKKRAKENEISALKKILARECQLNWALSEQITDICSKFAPYDKNIDSCPYSFNLLPTPSKKIRFEIIDHEGKMGGGLLSEPHTSVFDKHMLDVAKIDADFYKMLEPAYESSVELKHLRDSLVDVDDDGKWLAVDRLIISFSGYALAEIPHINEPLNKLYRFCTNEELSQGRIR